MSESRLKMFCVAPDIEEADNLEGYFMREDVKAIYMKKIALARQEAAFREKLPDTQEKVKEIMNKASKLL